MPVDMTEEDRFRGTVTALFDALRMPPDGPAGLQPPQFLSVDGSDVELDSTEDGAALRCSLVAGRFRPEPGHRSAQMRQVLRHNLALAAGCGVCVSLDGPDPADRRVVLQLALPYAGLGIADLMQRLNELVSLAEIYRDLLAAPTGRPPVRAAAGKRPDPVDAIIFQP